ncbi:Putative LIPOPROTEIN LPQP [Sandaracinus amylolyticus]|uniref:Putative LIPOPROTEIN LPQP n=1 Tax=Sandaracinus amylolyticus TaxID=927083 RepID=A0A0F6SH26_9BACT|nr:Putative LIPOPROTEIN LPQP [Sandaracinus amylolyticus]
MTSALATLACEGSSDDSMVDDASTATPDAGAPTGPPSEIGPAERPARLVVPDAHDGTTPLPLVVLLHGYSASAPLQDTYWRATQAARSMGFYLLLPNGTTDSRGNRFWNATTACCDFDMTGVDDVAYLTSLLDEAESVVPVDTSRVYFIGHSNGSYMSFRMACELSDRVAAIGGLAGADFLNDTDCEPAHPVSVLHVHGDADETVSFTGTAYYPSARTAVERWAGRAGCDVAAVETLEPIDLVTSLDGAETTVERWSTGCAEGHDAELWTIAGGSHVPSFQSTWMEKLVGWLLEHRLE